MDDSYVATVLQDSGQSIQMEGVTRQKYSNWKEVQTGHYWNALSVSDDCQKIWLASFNGSIYKSADGGENYTTNANTASWMSICNSGDGAHVAAVAYQGLIYISHDSGNTWSATDSIRNWVSIACSQDGNRLVAVTYPGKRSKLLFFCNSVMVHV